VDGQGAFEYALGYEAGGEEKNQKNTVISAMFGHGRKIDAARLLVYRASWSLR
jgi:hypothetical protein